MLLSTLLVATLSILPSTPAADPSVSLVRLYEARAARATHAPGTAPSSLHLTAPAPVVDLVTAALTVSAPLKLAHTADFPLDEGGGVSSEGRQILALLLGLIVGFGTGHLVARDTNGFVLFLVIDIAIIAASTVLAVVTPFKLLYLGLLISHIIQGLDAYAKAGGERIIELTRERAVRWAALPGSEGRGLTTTRAFAFTF